MNNEQKDLIVFTNNCFKADMLKYTFKDTLDHEGMIVATNINEILDSISVPHSKGLLFLDTEVPGLLTPSFIRHIVRNSQWRICVMCPNKESAALALDAGASKALYKSDGITSYLIEYYQYKNNKKYDCHPILTLEEKYREYCKLYKLSTAQQKDALNLSQQGVSYRRRYIKDFFEMDENLFIETLHFLICTSGINDLKN